MVSSQLKQKQGMATYMKRQKSLPDPGDSLVCLQAYRGRVTITHELYMVTDLQTSTLVYFLIASTSVGEQIPAFFFTMVTSAGCSVAHVFVNLFLEVDVLNKFHSKHQSE